MTATALRVALLRAGRRSLFVLGKILLYYRFLIQPCFVLGRTVSARAKNSRSEDDCVRVDVLLVELSPSSPSITMTSAGSAASAGSNGLIFCSKRGLLIRNALLAPLGSDST